MRYRSRSFVLAAFGALLALGVCVSLDASGAAGLTVASLRKIGSQVSDRGGVITIEASDPVPYVTSQPDPHTFVIELRDVVTAGFSDAFRADPRSPVRAITVENSRAVDGASVARVSLALSEAMRPRIRSSRNLIVVEAERAVGTAAAAAADSTFSAVRDVRVTARGAATALTLYGTGRLAASAIEEPRTAPIRLSFDLANATSALPNVVPIGQGPVERVRFTLNGRVGTRVDVDLTRRTPYRVESADDGQTLTLIFGESPSDPIAALGRAPAARAQAVPAPQPIVVAAQAAAPPPAGQGQSAEPFLEPVQLQPLQPVSGAGTNAPRYSGHPVSLDFQGADLRAVLRTFAEISGLNIVLDPTIQGSVDVSLKDVPWDQALDIILRANKLGYQVDGTIVRIAPLTVLTSEEKERKELAESQANAGALVTFTRTLSYAKAEDIAALLKSAQVLSNRGNPSVDTRTNTVIVTDLPARLEGVKDLITALDQPQPQVEIEARIVQTTRSFARTLGVQWGYSGRANNALGNTLPFAFPNQGSVTGRAAGLQGPAAPDPQTDSANTAVNLGVKAATSALGVALGSVNGAVNLDVALSALESAGQGRILSTPRVSTQNNIEAEITQGVQIPIQTVANNTVTVTFKDAALTLKVTPQITAANTVIMRISVENASPDFSRSVNNIPPIDTQRAVTQVLVSNGETTVIGGIYVSNEQAIQDRTPGLYRLPLLGWLFKRDGVTDESRELLIFITPRIIRL